MEQVLRYLEKLHANNSREWFHANKAEYTESRKLFSAFVQDIIVNLSLKDPGIEGIEPDKVMFRIFRDVRFSNDKTPYKTHYSAFIAKGGRKGGRAGYYIHVSPSESFLAAGIHTPGKEELHAIRQEIEFKADEFNLLVKKALSEGYTLYETDKLKTGPKGFSKESPQIEYLKNKHFLLSRTFKSEEVLRDDFNSMVVAGFSELVPFTLFLNEAISYTGNE